MIIDDLSQISLTARIKAEPPAGAYGAITFKLEDANMDAMEFVVVPDGTWQDVGGTLDTAAMVASGDASAGSDGVFDINSPWFKVVLVTWGPGATPEWTVDHTVIIDDIHLTKPGRSIADADSFAVSLAFENQLTTWGTGGSLTLDNLMLGTEVANTCAVTDVNCDGFTDSGDLLVIRNPSNWNMTSGTASEPRGDVNGDTFVDSGDLLVIRNPSNWNTTTGPCTCP